MAYRTSFSVVALFILLAISGQALAARNIPKKSKDADVDKPQFLLKSDRSLLIPGIGRVLLPPSLSVPSYNPYPGGSNFLPGGDDTLIPHSGFEVPSPRGGGAVSAATHP